MSDKLRKCIKCGASPSKDAQITLYRFPKPGNTNILRCELWAKYCFPDEPWSSPEFQQKLYSQHKMLCNKHFMITCFVDRKLFRTAVPSVDFDENTNPTFIPVEPYVAIAGPSGLRRPLSENTSNQLTTGVPEIATSRTKLESELEKKLHHKMVLNMKKVWRLRKEVKNLRNKQFLQKFDENASVKEVLKTKISSSLALILQGELQNFKRKPKGRRWTTEEKMLALRMYKRSPTCYKLLRRLFCLPAPGTLKSLLSRFEMGVGINTKIFQIMKDTVKNLNSEDKEFVLMFDEMSIKKHLWFNQKRDIIEGYQDHDAQGRSPQIASYALVFMVSGIRKCIKQPVAYYLSSGSVTADRLAVLIKEVLQNCFDAGLNIAVIVSDLDCVNKRAVSNLGATMEKPFFMFDNKKIITIFDTPHLLKCFRNLFLKYDLKCQTDITSDGKRGIGIAKWSYIKQFHELDKINPNFVYAPELKQDHLNPNTKQKMKVKLAAQVLSNSVSGGMYYHIKDGGLPIDAVVTAATIKKMDMLFDAVNASTEDLKRGKPCATNLTNRTPHLNFFKEMKDFFKNLNFIGSKSRPPSQDGWIWSLNGLEMLWHNLKTKHPCINSLSTRRIQQDPLENLFGCIRSSCGSNMNPTSGQFVAGLKTAVLSNLARSAAGNCEEDRNEIVIKNYQSLFAISPSDICTNASDDEPDDSVSENITTVYQDKALDNQIDSEMQACAYVCGFIVKNNKIKDNCLICKNILLSQSNELHEFIKFKEYDDSKTSLIYSSKNLIICVEKCATLINNYLEKESHKSNLKHHITEILNNVNWDFLNECGNHHNDNKMYIINSVFHICIKRFCILKNRKFAEECTKSALKRKIDILKHT